jgi:hypothetical protein
MNKKNGTERPRRRESRMKFSFPKVREALAETFCYTARMGDYSDEAMDGRCNDDVAQSWRWPALPRRTKRLVVVTDFLGRIARSAPRHRYVRPCGRVRASEEDQPKAVPGGVGAGAVEPPLALGRAAGPTTLERQRRRDHDGHGGVAGRAVSIRAGRGTSWSPSVSERPKTACAREGCRHWSRSRWVWDGGGRLGVGRERARLAGGTGQDRQTGRRRPRVARFEAGHRKSTTPCEGVSSRYVQTKR